MVTAMITITILDIVHSCISYSEHGVWRLDPVSDFRWNPPSWVEATGSLLYREQPARIINVEQ
jgi:hypothetical protein